MAQPVQTVQTPTTRSTMARLMQITNEDPQRGYKLQQDFQYLQSDPTSMYYNPYTKATNQAVGNLQAMGVDVSKIDNDWFDRNGYLKQYYNPSATTNNPTSPGKKATLQQDAAYQYYQVYKAKDDTEKAKTESAALKQELTYLANWKDRNYSDDTIIGMIDWSKYPTLSEMKESAKQGAPMVLNEAVDMATDDWMYGVIWAARNNGGTGSAWQDMARSYNGEGNVWKDDPAKTSKLNANDSNTYSPYEYGTTIDDAAKYFGVYEFDEKTVNDIFNNLDWNDKTQRDMYYKVEEAFKNTNEIKEAESAIYKDIDNLIKTYSNPEDIIDIIRENPDYSKLFELDETLTKGNKYNKLIPTTSAIDYRWYKVEQYINDKCAEKNNISDSESVLNNINASLQNPPTPAPKGAVSYETASNMPDVTDIATTPVPDAIQNLKRRMDSPIRGEANRLAWQESEREATKNQQYPSAMPLQIPVEGSTPEEIASSIENWRAGQKKNAVYTQEDWERDEARRRKYYDMKYGEGAYDAAIAQEEMDYAQQVASTDVSVSPSPTTSITQPIVTATPAPTEKGLDTNFAGNVLARPQEAPKPSVEVPQPAPTPAPTYSEAEIALENAAKEILSDLEPVVQTAGTDAEKLAIKTGKTAIFNASMAALDAITGNFAGAIVKNIEKQLSGNYVNASRTINDFNTHMTALSTAEENLAATEEEWQAKFAAVDQMIAETADPRDAKYATFLQTVDGDTSWYYRDMLEGAGLSAEDIERYNILKDYRKEQEEKIQAENNWMLNHKGEYYDAQRERNDISQAMGVSASTGDYVDENILSQIDYVVGLAQNNFAIQRNPYSLYDSMVMNGSLTREQAIAESAATAAQDHRAVEIINDTLSYLADHNIQLSDAEQKSINKVITLLNREARGADYTALDGKDDFSSIAEAGKREAINETGSAGLLTFADFFPRDEMPEPDSQGYYDLQTALMQAGAIDLTNNGVGNMSWYDILRNISPEEVNRYFYLYKTDGREAADNYLSYLTDGEYGELVTRATQTQQEYLQDYANRGVLQMLGAWGASFIMKPLTTASGLIYRATGGENPYNPAIAMQDQVQAMRTGFFNVGTKIFGENNFFGEALNKIAEIGTGILDIKESAALMAIPGKLLEGTKLAEMASGIVSKAQEAFKGTGAIIKAGKDIASILPLSTEAANQTWQDVMLKTDDVDKANAMAAVTFASDLLTHTVVMRGIKNVTTADLSKFANGVEKIANLVLPNAVAAAGSTAVSEIATKALEKTILQDASTWGQKKAELQAQGYSESMAEDAADRYVEGLIWQHTLDSAVSSIIRTGVLYGINSFQSKGGFKQLGKDAKKLGTSAKNAAKRGMNQLFPERDEGIVFDAEEGTILDADGNPVEVPVSGYIGGGEPVADDRLPIVVGDKVYNGGSGDAAMRQMQKDTTLLMSTYDANPTATSVVVASVLNEGNQPAAIAAGQSIVGNVANGDPKLAAQITKNLLLNGLPKNDLTYAALTKGEGRRELDNAIAKMQEGLPITYEDANAIIEGLALDRQAGPRKFENSFKSAIKDSMIANKTMEILRKTGANKKTRSAKAKTKDKKDTLELMQKNAEEAGKQFATTGENLKAVEAQYNPLDGDTAAQLQHVTAKYVGEAKAVRQAEENVEVAQRKYEQAQQEEQEVANETMAEARNIAVPQTEQELEETGEASYNNAVTAYPPTQPFGHTIEVFNSEGRPVQITGVYDVQEVGNDYVRNVLRNAVGDVHTEATNFGQPTQIVMYRTADGGLVMETLGKQDIDGNVIRQYGDVDTEGNDEVINATYRMYGNNRNGSDMRHPDIVPTVYFPASFPINANGQEVHMIGLVGKEDLGDAFSPVIMGMDGKKYSVEDPAFDDQINSLPRGVADSLFDAFYENEESLAIIPADQITRIEEGNNVGEEEPLQNTEAPIPRTVGEGNNEGQLPSTLGRDVGLGDNSDVGSDGGESSDGRNQEERPDADRQEVRGDPERLLTRYSKKVLKEKGVSDLRLGISGDSERFSASLDAAKASNDHGAFVDAQSPESLAEKGAIMILSSSGLSGAAVGTVGSEAGNIFGVFKNKRSTAKKASVPLIITAVSQGGNKLDCFDGYLRTVYSSLGFVPVSRTPFNREYAPEGWNYERDGEPDVVAYMLRPGENAGTIVEKYGTTADEGGYPVATSEDISKLPVFNDIFDDNGEFVASGYDLAMDYRDKLIDVKKRLPQGENAPKRMDGKKAYKGLAKRMGVPEVSELYQDLVYLSADCGEPVTQEEWEATPEVQFMRANSKHGSSLSMDTYLDAVEKLNSGEITFDEYVVVLNNEFTPERVIEQQKVKNEILDEGSARLIFDENGKGKYDYVGDVDQGRVAHIFMGLPATGKSKVADVISQKINARVVDNDDIKEHLSDDDDGMNNGYLHVESSFIHDQVLHDVLQNGDNLILPIIGYREEQLGTYTKLLKDAGYEIHLHRTELPQAKAIGRAMARAGAKTKNIDASYLYSIDPNKISEVYEKMKEGGDIDAYAVWSTDVDPKSDPIPVEASSESESAIFSRRRSEAPGENQNDQIPPSEGDGRGLSGPDGMQSVSGLNKIVENLGLTVSDHDGIPQMKDLTDSDGSNVGYVLTDRDGNTRVGLSLFGKYDTPEVRGMMEEAGFTLDPKSDEWVQAPTQPNVNAPLTELGVNPVDLPYTPSQEREGVSDFNVGQRQFGTETAQRGKLLHEEVKNYLYNNSEYIKDTNEAQLDRALKWIESHATQSDPDGFYGAISDVEDANFNPMSADGQARMLALMGMAATNNDVDAETRLASIYNKQGTDLGQALQARKMFNLMTPAGRKATLRKEAQKISDEYQAMGKKVDLKISEETLEAAANAKSEKEYNEARRKLERELAAQIPSDWRLRMRTLRMTAMLANPRTHIRNLEGNTMFIPMIEAKNAIGSALESIVNVKKGERTKAFKRTKESIAFAKKDYEQMKDELQGTAKYYEMNAVERDRKAFGTKDTLLSRTVGKAFQKLADFSSDLLEKEDALFLKYHYTRALSGYMTANGLTEEDMKGETLRKARAYAVEEAQKATYRDPNMLARWLSDQHNKPEAVQFVINAVQPFIKTPANIMRRGVEYSPVGLTSALVTARRKLNAYKEWEESGFKGPKPKNAKSPSEVLDKIAAGMTGTMICGLGAWLASLGILKVKATDAEKLEGSQDYSLEIDGKSFSISNIIPLNIPLLLGGSLYNTAEEMNGGTVDFGKVLSSISNIIEPVVDTTMMTSLNSLLETSRYSNSGDLTLSVLGQKILANYVASYVPSLVGSVAKTIDPTKRKAFVGSGDSTSIWTALIEQTQNKIPFLSMNNVPYIDAWGEEETSDVFSAFMSNFILPDKIHALSDSELERELDRLTEATGSSMLPKAAEKTLSINGESVKLTDRQWYQYGKAKGQLSKQALQELIERPEFITLSDSPEVQAELVKKVYKYAKAKATLEVFPDKNITDGWTKGAVTADNVIDYIFEKEEEAAKKEFISVHKQSLNESIDSGSAEAIKTDLDYLREAGVTDSAIKSSVTSYFKPLYKEAYENGDTDEMIRIQNTLKGIGLGYEKYGAKDWAKWEK